MKIDENLMDIIPNDKLKKKRVENLKKAENVFIKRSKRKKKIIGLVFVNRIFGFLPNITWITHPDHRRRGIATELIKEAQKHYRFLTAKTRNPASSALAKKNNFKQIIKNYWIYFRL